MNAQSNTMDTGLTKLTPEESVWVEHTLANLPLSEKIGQLFFPMLTSDTLKAEGFDETDMDGFCREFGIGGGHLFGGSLEAVSQWTRKAQSASRIPLLLSGDLDRGGGNRIKGGVLFPYQMALGAGDNEELAYALGKAISLESRLAGFNWALGPIVDLCASRDYQRHIATIGEDPEQVARLSCAQIRGIQDHGMAACAKHFPGDGHDDRDQHLVTLTNPLSEQEWWQKSAFPFQRSIEAGVHSIMVAGIAVPAMDSTCSKDHIPLPAVFSRKLLGQVLRQQMGFKGVLVSDALNMGGMSCHYPLFERYLRAFVAGVDALLFVRRLKEARAYLLKALESEIITETRLNESVRRILELKARLRLPTELQEKTAPRPPTCLGAPEFQEYARLIAESSITLLTDRQNQFPPILPAGAKVAHILISNRALEMDLAPFNRELEAAGLSVETFVNPAPEYIYDRVETGEFALVVTSFYYPIQWGWGTTRYHGPFIRSMMSSYHQANPSVKSVFISLGSPFGLYEMPFMDPFLVTYGESACSLKAVAQMVLGQIPVKGRVPVGMAGYFKRGAGIMR